MAFGLFGKKHAAADRIFRGGILLTQDPNLPRAEAVAVKDGRILAVGEEEDVAPFEGKHTERIDLAGSYLCPGLFCVNAAPVQELFHPFSLKLSRSMTREEVLREVEAYVASRPESPAYFGYGYDEAFFTAETHKGAKEALDAVCPERPLLLLGSRGQQAWCNTRTLELAEEAAREEALEGEDEAGAGAGSGAAAGAAKAGRNRASAPGLSALQIDEDDDEDGKTPGYLKDPYPGFQIFSRDEEGWPTGLAMGPAPILILMTAAQLLPQEALYEEALAQSLSRSKQGFTSVIDLGSPEYMDNLYLDILQEAMQEDRLFQRYFGSFRLDRNLDPGLVLRRLLQKNTHCMECDDFLNVNTLHVLLRPAEAAPAGGVGEGAAAGAQLGEEQSESAEGDAGDDVNEAAEPKANQSVRGEDQDGMSSLNIKEETLKALCVEAGDRGCDVHITAQGTQAIESSVAAFLAARSSGYKKSRFLLTGDASIEDGDLAASLPDADVILDRTAPPDPQELLDYLTTEASLRVRMEDRLGSLEKGKYADFTVFEDDPLQGLAGDGKPGEGPFAAPVVMTVLQGRIVYHQDPSLADRDPEAETGLEMEGEEEL